MEERHVESGKNHREPVPIHRMKARKLVTSCEGSTQSAEATSALDMNYRWQWSFVMTHRKHILKQKDGPTLNHIFALEVVKEYVSGCIQTLYYYVPYKIKNNSICYFMTKTKQIGLLFHDQN